MYYDVELLCKLYEIFPECFNHSKTVNLYDYKNEAFGQEKVCTGTEEVTLANLILDTAKAISREGTNMDGAFRFLNCFRRAKDQKRMIQKFYEN